MILKMVKAMLEYFNIFAVIIIESEGSLLPFEIDK
jgi:hypothetical protein